MSTQAARLWVFIGLVVSSSLLHAEELLPVRLSASVEQVQPLTGIVLWSDNESVAQAPIQLEFAYLNYRQVVNEAGKYDWRVLDELLAEVSSRRHQLILRWHDTYVGKSTGVPESIARQPGYHTTLGKSEGKRTEFPDWSHASMQQFVLEFFSRFASRYDRDPRIAYLQVGFGLWSEYHIYDGPMELGKTFPSLEFQRRFLIHLNRELTQTKWMISVDAANDWSPIAEDQELLRLPFGVFDDSFNHAKHASENEPNWNTLGRDRWQRSPAGGEFSFFEKVDQRKALDERGPHGISFEDQAAKFHVSFMIGDDQLRFQKPERVRAAGIACGYRFRVTRFAASEQRSIVEIENVGISPIYYDAFPAVNGVRAMKSLRDLLPGQRAKFEFASGGAEPKFTIECDRLVTGQAIGFEAALK